MVKPRELAGFLRESREKHGYNSSEMRDRQNRDEIIEFEDEERGIWGQRRHFGFVISHLSF